MRKKFFICVEHHQGLRLTTGMSVRCRMRRVAADRGMCGSSLQWWASHCPSLNPQCWQGSQDTRARRDTRSGCSVHRYLEWIVLFASVWHSQGFNPFPEIALQAYDLNLFSFLELLFMYFQIIFHIYFCLYLYWALQIGNQVFLAPQLYTSLCHQQSLQYLPVQYYHQIQLIFVFTDH